MNSLFNLRSAFLLLVILAWALGFFGCSVDTNALRPVSTDSHAPIKGSGVGLDGGTPSTPDTLPSTPDVLPVSPDATPGTDGIAADLLGVAPDLLPPDAGLALDGLARPTDTSPASDLRPAMPDVLPAPDLAPECPYIAWMTRPSTAEEQWGIKMTVPETATCFTVCGSLRYLWLDPAGARSVKVNDKPAARQLDPVAGYLPNLSADGPYTFRVGAGDPITLAVAGYPNNATGACP
jgi:hypothetical protein